MAINSDASDMIQTPETEDHGHGGDHGHVHHDPEGSRIGMWLFLYTELLLFGGMFILYAVYLQKYFHEFKHYSEDLWQFHGCINTLFLLTSSATMAMAISAIRLKNKKLSLTLLWATLGFAFAFFIVKYFEWSYKIDHGLYPGSEYLMKYQAEEPSKIIFYGLYYVMTGLHGLHVLIGAIMIAVCIWFTKKDWIKPDDYGLMENTGLYWHLVDLIWIYLFPLFYLIV